MHDHTSPSKSGTIATNEVQHCQWTHWIDSKAPSFEDEAVADEGEMYDLPDGRVLERGEMTRPEDGARHAYEEVWVDHDVAPVGQEGGRRQAALVLHQTDAQGRELARGMVVRVGKWCQGLLKVVRVEDGRDVAEISCERWEWTEDDWRRVVKIGRLMVPCFAAFTHDLREGATVVYGDWEWSVVEAKEW